MQIFRELLHGDISMNKSTFWTKFLLFDAILLVLSGLNFILSPILFPDIIKLFYSFYWGENLIINGNELKYFTFLYGIYGTLLVVFGVTIVVLSYHLIKNTNQQVIWTAITYGTIAWFLLESFVSIYSGAIINLVLNIIFTSLFIIPILGRKFESDN